MKVEQLYTKCLAQGAYYIESEGEAAIIDPLREVNQYIRMADSDQAKIKYIFETHFHADFVSGHVTLAKKTGATIVYGPGAEPSFDAHIAEDGELFKIGKLTLKVLHTPGHTLESSSFLLHNENNTPIALFSGDTLFLGDVGRPDLAQKASVITQDDLAGMLFDSLRNKIMPLPDDIIVYPGHGAGSACGKNMMSINQDTLGNQKKINYALRDDMTKEEFIEEVTSGLLAPPAYFPANVAMNRQGYDHIDDVLERALKPLNVDDVVTYQEHDDVLILDVRHQKEFTKGFIPNSLFIGIQGGFAPWVGELLKDTNQKIILVAPEDQLEETITRLARVGFDQVIGYVYGGFQAWKNAGKEFDTIQDISAEEFSNLSLKDINALDVRKPGEYQSSHISQVPSYPLSRLEDDMGALSKDKTYYIFCAGGYRSVIAASILKRHGFKNMVNVLGGYNNIKMTDLPRVESSCSKSQ